MRVLVIEDEPDLRRALKQALEETGYAVDQSADGEDGLFRARTCEYDAIILDLMLPKLNGWDVLRQLRIKKKTPVLILTARDGIPDRIRGLDTGADDYLIKPFALTELLARLRALIRRAAGQAQPILQFGDIAIDLSRKIVLVQGKLIGLTPREYALVEFLALHRGKLVTRTEIYTHLFDENDDSISNLVDVHVSNVRKKLGRDFIVTRRGQGYLIDD